MSRPHGLALASPAPRIVRGKVSSAGAVIQGSGFKVVRNGAGDYTVTFNRPFAKPPVVVVSLGEFTSGRPSIAARGLTGTPMTPYLFQVLIGVVGVSLADAAFDFIAIDP